MSDTYRCQTCRDTGDYFYPNTAWNMGVGGQAFSLGPCPGTQRRPDRSDCPTTLGLGHWRLWIAPDDYWGP